MTDKVIIDGVDVNGCHHFDKDNHQRKVFDCYEIEGFPNFCEGDNNCYFKQLQRLKAENGKLKKALEEIREIAKVCKVRSECFSCKYYNDCEFEDAELPTHDISKFIIDKINEVLK